MILPSSSCGSSAGFARSCLLFPPTSCHVSPREVWAAVPTNTCKQFLHPSSTRLLWLQSRSESYFCYVEMSSHTALIRWPFNSFLTPVCRFWAILSRTWRSPCRWLSTHTSWRFSWPGATQLVRSCFVILKMLVVKETRVLFHLFCSSI